MFVKSKDNVPSKVVAVTGYMIKLALLTAHLGLFGLMILLMKHFIKSKGLSTHQILEELINKELPPKADTPEDSGHGETQDTLTPQPDSKKGRLLLPITDHKSKNNVMTDWHGQLHLEAILMTEFNSLHKQKLPGVYVIPSALSPLIWNGVIFIRQGLYQEAVFRFNLNIPDNYPNGECPRVFFEFPVFHPCVDPKTGELDVKSDLKKWRPNVNFLWQVLMHVQRIFFKIDTQSPSNPEAAVLYEQNIEKFKIKIAETVRSSKHVLYNPDECNDAHTIRLLFSMGVNKKKPCVMCKHERKKPKRPRNRTSKKKKGSAGMKSGTTQIC